MKKQLLTIFVFLAILPPRYGCAEDKIDWSVCKEAVRESCSEIEGDKNIHDCLGKLDVNRLSKDCQTFFKSKCSQFGKRCKHRHHHGHGTKRKR